MISVIVPVYNVKDYLVDCLDSILNQSYKDLEIILVDDGSTDGSDAICDAYEDKDERIRVIHQENRSLSVARNVGMSVAKGEYIAFVDSDDALELDMYEKLHSAITASNADIAICGFHQFSEDRIDYYQTTNALNREIDGKILESVCFFQYIDTFRFMVWNKLYRTDALRGIEFIPRQIHQDIHFQNLVMQGNNKICYLNEGLYKYRVNRQGSTNTKKFKTTRLGFIEEFASILEYLNSENRMEAYDAFWRYAFRYYFNESRLACELNAAAEDKDRLVNGFRKMVKKVGKSHGKMKMTIAQRLYFISPRLYMALYKMKCNTNKG